MPLSILLAVDRPGWCFHNNSQELIKHLSVEHAFTVMPHVRIAKEKTDIAVNFWWGSACRVRSCTRARAHVACIYDGLSWRVDQKAKHQFKLMLQNVDALGVCNRRFISELEQLYGAALPPMTLIEDGVDLELFHPQPFPSDFSIGWAGDSTRMTPGGPPDQKGVQLFREAIKLCGVKGKILDASKGGAWPHAKMPEFYRDCSVVACLGYVEGTPNPLLEAMSSGRPVLATRSPLSPGGPGLAEYLLVENGTGWLVDRNPKSVGEAILHISQLPRSELQRIGDRARLAVRQHSWQEKVKPWRKLFTQALQSAAQRKMEPSPWQAPSPAQQAKIEEIAQQEPMLDVTSEHREIHHGLVRLETIREALDQVQAKAARRPKPLVWVLSGWRFLNRTLKIIEHMVDEFRFEVYPMELMNTSGLPCSTDPSKLPDLCWALYPFNDGQAARGLKLQYGIPFILSCRGAFWRHGALGERMGHASLKEADLLITLTDTLRRQAIEQYPELRESQWSHVPNGTDPILRPKPDQLRPINGAHRPLILTVSNLEFTAKREAVIQMAQALDDVGFGGTYLIVGKGAGMLTGPFGKCGWYRGFNPDVANLLYQADLFLYPSEFDSQPTALMEAMSAGLPCLVQDHEGSGAWELIDHGQTGLMFESYEEAAHLAMTVLDPEHQEQKLNLGRAAQELIREHLTWHKCAERHTRLFHQVLQRPKR